MFKVVGKRGFKPRQQKLRASKVASPELSYKVKSSSGSSSKESIKYFVIKKAPPSWRGYDGCKHTFVPVSKDL